ncbi:S41 family peptidase [Mycoplasma leachii]|uniref:Putative lipoprotein and peptidase n=1 Tax=Mycoplasma leachii 06049 TaxID=1188244 RepID=A0A2T4I8R3_9MOLU|nr:S41 family peptidase [Mycoplasma leachii]PTD30895.1 putative lipoprotein and peptidase [Mycoplasma leachii 06049]
MKKTIIFLTPILSLLLLSCKPGMLNTINQNNSNNKLNNKTFNNKNNDKQSNLNNINSIKKDKANNSSTNSKNNDFKNLLDESNKKRITKQTNSFKVSNTPYKVSDLTNLTILTKNTINLTKYQDIDYIDLDQFLDLFKDILEINQKTEEVIYNNNSYLLNKELKKEINNNLITIKLINKYQSKDKNKTNDFIISEFIKFDFLNKKIIISSVNFYNLINSYQNETNLKYHYFKTLESKPLIIDLNKYNIYMFHTNNNLYLPLIVLNQIFLSESEKQIYFNNKNLFIFEVFDLYQHNNNETKKKLSSNKQDIKLSNKLKEFQYNYLWFLLDNFYPLKLENNKSYKDYLTKYKTSLLKDNLEHFKTTNLIIRDLNDIHTKVLLQSPLYDLKTNDSDLFVNENNRNDRIAKFRKYEKELVKLSSNLNEKDIRYTKDNKTAIIKIDLITRDTIKGVKNQLEQIKNKKEVKNVVFDLTLNKGGSLLATFIIIGFLTNQSFKYHKLYPNTNNKEIINITSNIGKFDFNYYILNSPINYSAGNTFASIIKTNKLAKNIGYKSGGGASEVRLAILPTGTIIRKSSLYTLTDNNWNSYELGVDPDIEFKKDKNYNFNNLFDLEYIQNIINNDQKVK